MKPQSLVVTLYFQCIFVLIFETERGRRVRCIDIEFVCTVYETPITLSLSNILPIHVVICCNMAADSVS